MQHALNSSAWNRLAPYFDRALDLDPSERETWLAELTATEPDIAQSVREMLRERDLLNAQGFLEQSPLESVASRAGLGVGPYTIDRLLGRGGMGEVWLAKRSDGRYEGACAIKFLEGALANSKLAERFRREGQMLARLTHPHIARLLDAGATEDGAPYLALEYVDGQRIDAYCELKQLSIVDRVRLFVDVIAAVAHAHSQLVIHRDLKPSNVLVTADGQVKLLDFGIAKLLRPDQVGVDDSDQTRVEEAAFTPDYAAPEQLLGESPSTATDVYQLGVLLYVLLTGELPQRIGGSRADRIRAALDEPLPRPSAVVDRRSAARLRGDLDAIIACAVRKNPGERYPTAQALKDELLRYLNHEPVMARRAAGAYRLQKFVSRHRVAVASSVTAVVALVAALSFAVVQAQVARGEARRAADINAFILSLFESASLSGGGNSELRAVDMLQQSLPRIDRELAGQPERQIDIYLSVGRALAELNAYPESLKAFAKVEEVSSRHGLASSATAIHARIETASALVGVGDVAEAESVLDAVDKSLATTAPGLLHARGFNVRSYLQLNQQQSAEAVRSGLAAVALFERHAGRDHPETLSALLTLVRARYHADQCAVGLPEIGDALTRVPAGVDTAIHPLTWVFRGVRARCLADVNRSDESAAEFERNDAYVRTTFGAESRDYATELIEHARVEHDRGNLDAGLALLDRADAIYNARGPYDRNQYSVSLRRVRILIDARRIGEAHAEAERLLKMVTTEPQGSPVRLTNGRFFATLTQGLRGDLGAVVADAQSLPGTSGPSTTATLRFRVLLGRFRLLVGDPDAALRHLESAMPELIEGGPLSARNLTTAQLYAGDASLDLGSVDRAREYLEQALDAHPKLYSVVTPERADLWVSMARLRLQNGDVADARKFAEQADAFWSQRDPFNPWAGEAAYWLGRTLEAAGDRATGSVVFKRASKALRTSSLPVHLTLAADASTRAGPTRR